MFYLNLLPIIEDFMLNNNIFAFKFLTRDFVLLCKVKGEIIYQVPLCYRQALSFH